jgi:hypothetical protein
MWNNHVVRPSKNVRVPSGRPIIMHSVPSLWGATDQLCGVNDGDVAACRSEAAFRSTTPCDADVYTLCMNIMRTENIDVADDETSAIDLFQYLRQKFRQLL